MVKVTAKARAQVQRGPESWNYIYVFLGFMLAIEGDRYSAARVEMAVGPYCVSRFGGLYGLPVSRECLVSKQAYRLKELIRGLLAIAI